MFLQAYFELLENLASQIKGRGRQCKTVMTHIFDDLLMFFRFLQAIERNF